MAWLNKNSLDNLCIFIAFAFFTGIIAFSQIHFFLKEKERQQASKLDGEYNYKPNSEISFVPHWFILMIFFLSFVFIAYSIIKR